MTILWGRALPPKRLAPTKWHVSGHSVSKRVRVKKALGCVQVDPGCVFGIRLSAWCPETQEIVSVKGRVI
jgi:hypothetical protein